MALAGQTWDVRLRQSLLANGVAVLQLNPYSMDLWEWCKSLALSFTQNGPRTSSLFLSRSHSHDRFRSRS